MGGAWVLVLIWCRGPICGETIVVRQFTSYAACSKALGKAPETMFDETAGDNAREFLLGCQPLEVQ